jgi:hypothetical protein
MVLFLPYSSYVVRIANLCASSRYRSPSTSPPDPTDDDSRTKDRGAHTQPPPFARSWVTLAYPDEREREQASKQASDRSIQGPTSSDEVGGVCCDNAIVGATRRRHEGG